LRPSPIRSAAGGLIRFVQALSSAAEEAGDHGIYDRSLAVAFDIAPSHQRSGAQRCMSVGSAVSIATARLQLQDIANKGGNRRFTVRRPQRREAGRPHCSVAPTM